MQRNPWFVFSRAPRPVTSRLFCFPYAGGSANIYDRWAQALAGVEIAAIQLPGRGARWGEQPLDAMEKVIGQLLDGIRGLLDLPFSFFGHSYGALICFELARELRRRGITGPRHLILSGKRAPHLPPDGPGSELHELPHDQFIDALRAYNGTPAEVLEDQQLMELCLPYLRADFKSSETYRYRDDIRLQAQVSLFGGDGDPFASEQDMLRWRDLIASDVVSYSRFSGGHFFIHSDETLVLNEVKRILTSDGFDESQ